MVFPKNGKNIFSQKYVFSIIKWFSIKWYLNQKMENYIFFKKMVSQSSYGFPKYGFSIIIWFPLNGFSIKKWFPKIWFLNQKMVSQNMVSQSLYGKMVSQNMVSQSLYGKMVSQNMVSQSKNGFPKNGKNNIVFSKNGNIYRDFNLLIEPFTMIAPFTIITIIYE